MDKKAKAKSNKKEAAEQVPAAQTEVTEQATTEAATETSPTTENDTSESYEVIVQRIEERAKQLKELQGLQAKDYKKLSTSHHREVKDARKNRRTQNANKPPKAPSGFNKPSPVPNELAEFLGVPLGTQMARTQVTSKLYSYIKENKLQNVTNPTTGKVDRRVIVPDDKLRKLFGLNNGDQIQFKTFQTHVSKLYPSKEQAKEQSKAPADSSAVASPAPAAPAKAAAPATAPAKTAKPAKGKTATATA